MNKSKIPELCIWVLYALGTGASLVLLAFALSAQSGYITVPGVVGAVLTAVLPGMLVVGVHKLAQKEQLREFLADKKLTCIIVEGLLFVAMLVGMVLLRPEMSWDVEGSVAYKAAQVTPGRFYIMEPHGGYRVYLYLLNIALMLLGNRPFAAIVLQLVLLVCAAVSLYFGVRRLGGPMAALFATAFLGFAPYMVAETCNLNGFLVFLFCYGIALNCIGGISYSMTQSNHLLDQIAAVLCYIASGAFVGFSCYLDVAGITLLVILTGVICFDDDIRLKGEEERDFRNEETIRPGSLRAFEKRFAEFVGSPVVVFIGIVLVAAIAFWQMHGEFASLFRQLGLYTPDKFWVFIPTDLTGGLLEMILVNALLVFGVISFWCSKRIGNRRIWLFAVILMAVMVCFGMTSPEYFDGYAFLYLLCVILAGCGMGDVCAKAPEKVEKAEDEQVAIIDMDAPGEKTSLDEVSNEGVSTVSAVVADAQPAPVINFIENPLPLPKKHERKVMDYDYEVADDDDFDIP